MRRRHTAPVGAVLDGQGWQSVMAINESRVKGTTMSNGQQHVTDADCRERSGAILVAVEKLNARLYRDNGTISIQTRLDRHEQSLRLLCRLVYGAIALALVAILKSLLTGIVLNP